MAMLLGQKNATGQVDRDVAEWFARSPPPKANYIQVVSRRMVYLHAELIDDERGRWQAWHFQRRPEQLRAFADALVQLGLGDDVRRTLGPGVPPPE
jgi:hypothetical protein